MPRSEESKARRRAYTKKWFEERPEYKRDWAKEHRERERERQNVWRSYNRDLVREQKRRYYAKHPRRLIAIELPAKFTGHDFFETARYICGDQPYFDTGLIWEETMSEVVLALLEGRDPAEAARETRSRELLWRITVGELYPNTDVREHDRKVVFLSARD